MSAGAGLFLLASLMVGVAPSQAIDGNGLVDGCASYDRVLEFSLERRGEVPMAVIQKPNGLMIGLTINPASGSWTAWALVTPETACLVDYSRQP